MKLTSGTVTLALEPQDGGYGLSVYYAGESAPAFVGASPLSLYTKKITSAPLSYGGLYDTVTPWEDGLQAEGTLTTRAGSRFRFRDRYTPGAEGGFHLRRRVTVEQAGERERGFSTRVALQLPSADTLSDVNCFAPRRVV